MSLQLITAPTAEPVTVDEMKRQLNHFDDSDDVVIAQKIVAARRLAEVKLRRQFVTATWRYRLPCFPTCEIKVPLPPLASVTTLQYVDTGGTTQSLTENTDFVVDAYREPGTIAPAYGKSWPTTRDFQNSVVLTFVAGYGEPNEVPENIRDWIKAAAAVLFDRRELAAEVALKEIEFLNALLLCESWGSYA